MGVTFRCKGWGSAVIYIKVCPIMFKKGFFCIGSQKIRLKLYSNSFRCGEMKDITLALNLKMDVDSVSVFPSALLSCHKHHHSMLLLLLDSMTNSIHTIS